jgi:O-antigen/teichoic acid export membrane protein
MQRTPLPSADPSRAEPVRRTVGGGASLATIAQIFTALGGGLAGVVVARFLGAADTGSFNLVLSLLLILLAITPLGLEFGTSYFVGRGSWAARDARPQLLVAAAVLGVIGACVGVLAVAIDSGEVFPGLDVATAALGLAALPFATGLLLGSYMALAVDRYEAFALAPAVQALTLLTATAALIPAFDLPGACAALLLSNAIAATTIWWINRRATEPPTPGWLARARIDLAQGVSFGIRGTATASLGILLQRADLFVVSAVAGRAATGHYAIALSLTTLQAILPRALSTVVFPRVAALDAASDRSQEEMVLIKAIRHGILLAAASGAVVAVGALAIPVVYGSEFEEAIPLTLILVPGGTAFGVTSVLSAAVLGKGRPGLLLRGALAVTPAGLILYVVAGVTVGVEGVAFASTFAYIAMMAVAGRFFVRSTGLRGWRRLLPAREELRDYAALARRGAHGVRAR